MRISAACLVVCALAVGAAHADTAKQPTLNEIYATLAT